MSPPWDPQAAQHITFGIGAAVGGTAGLFCGYQLRKLVVRVQQWRANRYHKLAREYDAKRQEAIETGWPVVTSRQEPEYIPIKRTRSNTPRSPEVMQEKSANPDRDDVIAALMGAGYKKTEAIKAVDACSLAERASGVTMWMLAALRHAQGGKS
jgi:hypothetical protein